MKLIVSLPNTKLGKKATADLIRDILNKKLKGEKLSVRAFRDNEKLVKE